MHIKLKSDIAGERFAYAAGDLVDWNPDEEAQRLVGRGLAVALKGPPPSAAVYHGPPAAPETAALGGPPETAARKPGRPRKPAAPDLVPPGDDDNDPPINGD